MWSTYGQTVHFHGMMDGHVMWLTYGQTSHVEGMTDGHVLSVTYESAQWYVLQMAD